MFHFVSNITFKSNTYAGNQEYNPPLIFDNNKFNYFIKILNVRFSNNIPNIKKNETLSVDGSVVATIKEGLYEINDLVEIVNNAQNILKFSVNEANGHMTIKNLTAATHTVEGSLIQTIQFGKFANLYIAGNQEAESPEMCSVSDFNFFKLSSNIISPASYETNGDSLTLTNTLYTFAATINKFGHKDFCAFENIAYPLNMDQLQKIDFELLDENGNVLKPLKGAKSDFNVQAIIIKVKKSP